MIYLFIFFFFWATLSWSFSPFSYEIFKCFSAARQMYECIKTTEVFYRRDVFVFSRVNERQNNRNRVWNWEARCETRAVNRHRQWTSLTRWPTDTLAYILGLSHTHTMQQWSPRDKWAERCGVTGHWALHSFNEACSHRGLARGGIPVCFHYYCTTAEAGRTIEMTCGTHNLTQEEALSSGILEPK